MGLSAQTLDAVRHIAVAAKAGVIALGAFESRVQVWRRHPPAKVGDFATVLQFGGQRLALSADGAHCFAAAYHANGVACHDACNGSLLWQRRDLKKVQVLCSSISGEGVYCFFDEGAAHLLSTLTGETMARHRGVRGLVQSPFAAVDLVIARDLELRVRAGRVIRNIPRSTFAVLSACFSPDLLLISESGGDLRCFDASTGEEAWRFHPEAGEHFLSVAYAKDLCCFHGVAWPYMLGGEQRLFRMDADGNVQSLLSLGKPNITAFASAELVTSDGDVIDLHSLASTRLWPLPTGESTHAPV